MMLLAFVLALVGSSWGEEADIVWNGISAKGMSAGDVLVDMKSPTALEFLREELQSAADHGLDMSTTVTSSAASCMVSGYSFVVPRGYRSSGAVDTAVCSSIKNAHNAGIKHAESYLFPCPTCSKSAGTQVGELVDYLNANCASQWSGRIWLDIEGSQYWHTDHSANKDFYQKLVDACRNKSKKCGVYSSASQWSAIFGSTSYKYGNDLPLWYAHYDNNPSFSDFSAFGGWSTPHAKQYAGTTTVCSTGVDKNYSPSF